MTWESVDLPERFGPMTACTSPLFTVSDSPWRISRSSTRTCRFLTSSNGIRSSVLVRGRHLEARALLARASKDEGYLIRQFQSFLDAIEPALDSGNIDVIMLL